QKPHGPRYLLVEKPADSTAISCGIPFGLSRKDRDWAAMSVARSAFGEHRQFNGRLMQRLRELPGLNYGDYAYIEHFEQPDDDSLEMRDFLLDWRGALRGVTPAQVNAAWRKWIKPDALQCVLVGPGMTEVKKTLLSDGETPMHYQKDAQGNVPQKPAGLFES